VRVFSFSKKIGLDQTAVGNLKRVVTIGFQVKLKEKVDAYSHCLATLYTATCELVCVANRLQGRSLMELRNTLKKFRANNSDSSQM